MPEALLRWWAPAPIGVFECNLHPTPSRLIPLGVLLLVFVVLLWLRRAGDATRQPAAAQPTAFEPIPHLAPAWTQLLLATLVVLALLAAHYALPIEREQVDDWIWITEGRGALFSAARESAARGYWAVMLALSSAAALLALWFVAGLGNRCEPAFRDEVLSWVFVLATIAAVALMVLVVAKQLQGGAVSAIGNALLCAGWGRIGSPWLAPLSDMQNVVGFVVPVVLATGACLLLAPADVRGLPTRAALHRVAERSRSLDQLLYIGALCLVLGTLHLSAAFSLAVGPFDGSADVKLRAELCRQNPLQAARCADLPTELHDAEAIDDAKRFVRLTISWIGIAYSALLVALYAPAAYLLMQQAEALTARIGMSAAARHRELSEAGIESDLLGKLAKVATTMSPLAAGLISSAVGSAG